MNSKTNSVLFVLTLTDILCNKQILSCKRPIVFRYVERKSTGYRLCDVILEFCKRLLKTVWCHPGGADSANIPSLLHHFSSNPHWTNRVEVPAVTLLSARSAISFRIGVEWSCHDSNEKSSVAIHPNVLVIKERIANLGASAHCAANGKRLVATQ